MTTSRRLTAGGTMYVRDDEISDPNTGTFGISGSVTLTTNGPATTIVSAKHCVGDEVRGEAELTATLV